MSDLLHQLRNSLADAYTIESELGGGGMSRVFLADEIALGRRVVIKVLPPDLSGSVSIARFKREISLAARLQHPHIVPVLSVGTAGEVTYYTMPFVEGASLSSRLAAGPLSIPEAVSVFRDVARALDYAHSKGVAHRDIKPDNILLAGSSAVITDFGVAKALKDAAVGGGLTSVGVALGTPAYMAPEQVAADPGVDHRADIYSFGATAYEAIAGRPPFADRPLQAMMAAHITEMPRPLAEVRPDVSPSLATLVMRCLEKDPANRPETAREIVSTLEDISITRESAEAGRQRRRWPSIKSRVAIGAALATIAAATAALTLWRMETAPTASDIRSIAVLPCENTSGDSTFDYLEDGITDQVRDVLNEIPALTVKARSSSRQVIGQSANKIGPKLKVGAVLQCTVSRSRDRLHVTAELVRTTDEAAIWSRTFDDTPSELAGIQNTIAGAIVSKLGVAAAASISSVTARTDRGTSNIDAYYRFLQGRYSFDHQQWDKSSEHFRDAVRIDSKFARGYGYLAMAYGNETLLGGSPDSLNALSAAAANRAIALDSTVAEAYVAQGYLLLSEMRFGDAMRRFEKSAKFGSTNAEVLANYALALTYVGRLDDALEYAARGRQNDPLSANANGIYSAVLYMLGRYQEAIAAAHAALDLDPKSVIVYQELGYYFAFSGMADSSVAAFETSHRINPELFLGRANLVFGYAAANRWDDARRERMIAERERKGDSPNLRQAVIYIAFGEYEHGVDAIDRAIAKREIQVGVLSLACDPIFDPLKSNPRFHALLARIGSRACPAVARWPLGHPS